MMKHDILTLGLDLADIAGAVVVLLVIFGSAAWQAIQKGAEKKRQQRQAEMREEGQLGGQGMRTRRQDRMSAGGGGSEPTNMTMAERIARARAKAQYEERAKQTHAPQQQRHEPTSQVEPGAHVDVQLQMQRQQEQRRRLEEQRRLQLEQQRQRQMLEQQRQLDQQRRRSADELKQQQQFKREKDRKRRLAAERAAKQKQAQQEEQAQRRVAMSATSAAIGQSDLDLGNVHDLRRAIVLKEILDKPIGLRDPDDELTFY
ncbi:hypothetical protein [Poriferisphaera sp. WC338]|uniref:hypothetical protein n=1 Tax=Poriferisphaera sp. WC338 TaxID=3425129 RepID=UPI003D818FFF